MQIRANGQGSEILLDIKGVVILFSCEIYIHFFPLKVLLLFILMLNGKNDTTDFILQ